MRILFLLLLLPPIVLSIPVQDSLIKHVLLHTATLQLPTVRQGKNFDICRDDSDCDGGRFCVSRTTNDDGDFTCGEDDTCNCAPVQSPICPINDCDEAETCARPPGGENAVCVSDTVIANSNGGLIPLEEDGTQPPTTTTAESTTAEATLTAATTTGVSTTTAGDGATTTATDGDDGGNNDRDVNDCPDD